MKNIFINPETNVIRAGWRLVIFLLLFSALNAVLMIGVRTILGGLPAAGTLWFFLLGIGATLASYITTEYITKNAFQSLGLRMGYVFKDILIGILISAFIMTLMYLTLLGFDLIRFDGFSWWSKEAGTLGAFTEASIWTALAVLFQFIVVAWWEELVFRGIILQNIAMGLNLKWGVFISTIGFAVLHATNPSATIMSTLIIMLITLKLVYAYMKTGQLWLAVGLHLGWNFFQASIFGFASSGHVSPALIAQTPIAPDWLSGGDFGAENSVVIIPFTLGSFYLIHLWVKFSRGLQRYKMFNYLVSDEDFNQANIKTEQNVLV
ncbi:CPBP family intramembrane glutamic endopeptidase [Marinigracilibium pacificum]|uniref:CPBP family intramembrane metalloprotease n=1 Tax=Marinigracilibium pacificum TaxID=2729599 RepID=A0A848J043_9BACT|nr:type II CAAX endopeptidase family protein [Marinigracilibium pacificum]NMM47629.1 CPBP family intramembrane metalloprotease [Marinigracilibium pacificum]